MSCTSLDFLYVPVIGRSQSNSTSLDNWASGGIDCLNSSDRSGFG